MLTWFCVWIFQPIRIEHFTCSAEQIQFKLSAGVEDLNLVYLSGGGGGGGEEEDVNLIRLFKLTWILSHCLS